MATKKNQYPIQDIIMNDATPAVVDMVIKHLKEIGVPFYKETTKFDPEYPYLIWDNDFTYVSQSKECEEVNYRKPVSVGEFIEAFIKPTSKMISLNDEYNAIVSATEVQVGYQTIPISKVEEILKIAKQLK